jgi:hypothetical protein
MEIVFLLQYNLHRKKYEKYNSEHRKMRVKQQHVCKEMNQYMINTKRKWILSFGIEWTIGVKYRKWPFNLNKKNLSSLKITKKN